ncbi:carboxymuconolactone decarboxylase family protein [Bradyrhizobium macuxiense]|nr:carboxymuconolactone decarboxylase family protein [Bradyrhizobium macuxiense]
MTGSARLAAGGEQGQAAPVQFRSEVKSMSRVSAKTRDDLPAELRPLWDKMTTYGAFENQAGVMAQRPPIFKHMWSLLVDLADEAVVSKRHLELGLVTVSLLNKCDYCVSHHAPKLAIQGVSQAGAERLLDYKDHPELDDVDKLVVEYAIAVTNNWDRTRDEIFNRLREHFSEAQIVELTWRIALCGAFNRFNDILQLEVEDGVPHREAAE